MGNELKIINEQEILGKDFKVYGSKENPLFLAKDVAEWLEMDVSNASRMIKNIDTDEYITTRHNNTSATFLTEDGLYEVLMQSRKPIAKQFKKEVKKVLKQIRQTGGYIPIDEEMSDDEIMARALIVANNTIKKKDEIIKTQKKLIKDKDEELDYKEDVIIGLVKDISLAEKRQRITQIVRYRHTNYSERYRLLYEEFQKAYHLDIKRRMENAIEKGTIKKSTTKMDYVCDILNMTGELYEVCCKLFENDTDALMEEIRQGIK